MEAEPILKAWHCGVRIWAPIGYTPHVFWMLYTNNVYDVIA